MPISDLASSCLAIWNYGFLHFPVADELAFDFFQNFYKIFFVQSLAIVNPMNADNTLKGKRGIIVIFLVD